MKPLTFLALVAVAAILLAPRRRRVQWLSTPPRRFATLLPN